MGAVVVGGGVGGLAAAIALRRVGWDVTVLERSPAPGEIGAGISLWPNALAALEWLDVWPGIRDASVMQLGGVRRPSGEGRWLSRLDPSSPPPAEILLVHRADLHRELRAALGDGALVAGATVTAVTASGSVTYTHAGTEHTVEAKLVVAADGLRSTVRTALWPDHPGARYAGFTAWRAVTREPFALDAAAETWGRGCEFGATILVGGGVYWFATANLPEGTTYADEHAEVVRRFAGWHDPIGRILTATDPSAVLRHDIYELARPLPRFARNRVALLGDAAHAMTPNLGQGACQALEDAVELAHFARPDADIATALLAYDASRRPRTERLVAMSARTARFVQTGNPMLVAARNALVRMTPQRLAAGGITRAIAWRPPTSLGS